MDLPTSIDLATNKLIATTLSGIAEFENARRKDRQKQGIRTAQKEGKYTGRKSVINQTLIRKVKEFFEEVQTGILLTSFSDNYFQSLVAIPLVKLHKIQKFWVGRVWLAEELFYYNYPFLLPDFFKTKLTKDQFEVRVEVIKVFHSVDITKTFLIQQFLDSYSTVSNQRINKIKKNFIELVEILQEYDLIESNYKIISNGSFLDTKELNISNISEGFVIYEKIYI